MTITRFRWEDGVARDIEKAFSCVLDEAPCTQDAPCADCARFVEPPKPDDGLVG